MRDRAKSRSVWSAPYSGASILSKRQTKRQRKRKNQERRNTAHSRRFARFEISGGAGRAGDQCGGFDYGRAEGDRSSCAIGKDITNFAPESFQEVFKRSQRDVLFPHLNPVQG